MKTRSAKAKGKRLQDEIAEKLRKKFGFSETHIRTVPSSVNGIDLILSEDVRKLFNWDIEAKCQEKLSIWSALKQASDNSILGKPLLIFSRNRTEPYVCLKLDDFLSMFPDIDNKSFL